MKRIFDLIASLIGGTILIPLILFLSCVILLFNGWPVFFIQPRLGKNKIPFNMIKFRTMKSGISKNSEFDAARLTKIGKLLRKTSVDELPVLFNVIKGDMSLVGPRPLLLKYGPRFSPKQDKRHHVLPGITGLAQINGRNTISWEDKFDYDIQYVKNHSFWIDLKILIQTMFLVIKFQGTSPPGEDIMSEFMGTENNDI